MIVVAALALMSVSPTHGADVSPNEARAIAKDAYIYAFPMFEGYKTLYAQAVGKSGPNYKAPFIRWCAKVLHIKRCLHGCGSFPIRSSC